MKFYNRLLTFFLLSIILGVVSVQAQQSEDIVLKAMQDEMNNNLQLLKLTDYDKPFYIMYGLVDARSYYVSATLGAITRSGEDHQRQKINTRVLVGDYDFNDESLEDNLFSPPSRTDIELPLEDDYYGIRRSFWSSTDNVYRDATKHFERHKTTVKESGKSLSDLPHRTFAKGEPITLISSEPARKLDRSAWENRLRKLSGLFLKHPTVTYSAVSIQYTEGHQYITTTEGTVAKLPFSRFIFSVMAQSKQENGEFDFDQAIHQSFSPESLPADEILSAEIAAMIENLEKSQVLPKAEEEYNGPVLVMGPALAKVVTNELFFGRESLTANNTIARTRGLQFDTEIVSLENKIGKPFLHESITIKARPKLRSYQGVDLLGWFTMDAEGMVPPDELVLVEQGVLKNLLNDRTLTNATQVANGFSSGPGVLEFQVSLKKSETDLRKKLMEQARKEGLDYAYIIHDLKLMGTLEVTRISVADGKEEQIQGFTLGDLSAKTFKRVLGASEKSNAYNIVGTRNFVPTPGGLQVSCIVPDSVILEEVELQPLRMPRLLDDEDEYVSNPLKK